MAKPDVIKMNHEVTLSSTIKFEGKKVYEEVLCAKIPMALEISVKKPCPPYNGRVPRFALWGARGRIIQIGSKEDAAWYQRVRRKQVTVKMTVHKVDVGPEVRPVDHGETIHFPGRYQI